MKLLLFFSFLLFCKTVLLCQVYTEKDIEICKAKFKISESTNLSTKPIGDVIVRIGESFTGTDYKAYTLETEGVEKLVVDLKGFDCTTFLESVLAFARLIKKDSASFENYLKELTYIR